MGATNVARDTAAQLGGRCCILARSILEKIQCSNVNDIALVAVVGGEDQAADPLPPRRDWN